MNDLLSPYVLLIVASVIIILSFFYNLIAKRTNVPSVLMLISTGIILNLIWDSMGFAKIDLMPSLELLGIVGLIMIVLEAALDLELKREKLPIIIKSFSVAVLSLAATSYLIALIFMLSYKIDLSIALMYSLPLSIMSSAIVIPSASNLIQSKKEFMIYESTFSDIIGIMIFYFIIEGMEAESSKELTLSISINVILTIAISLLVSYGLVFVFHYVKAQVKLFFFIAILIALYSVGKLFHLSSLLIILVFGLILHNRHIFIRGFMKQYLDESSLSNVFSYFKVVTMESAFMVRTFFFVIFGLTLSLSSLLDIYVVFISLIILLLIYVIRIILMYVFVGKDIFPQLYMVPRGLITILLFYAIPKEFQIPDFNNGILLFIILGSSVIMAISLVFDKRDYKAPVPVQKVENHEDIIIQNELSAEIIPENFTSFENKTDNELKSE